MENVEREPMLDEPTVETSVDTDETVAVLDPQSVDVAGARRDDGRLRACCGGGDCGARYQERR